MSNSERFRQLFLGSSIAHGHTTLGPRGRNGKQEAVSRVRKGALDNEMIQSHLDGVSGIGAIPIDVDNLCSFGVIDIDTYPLDLVKLNKKLRQLKMPLTICRSKSGGAHLYVFLNERTEATLVREALEEMASILGHAGAEIFPKQTRIQVDRGETGNFINLPYFNHSETMRYGLDKDGEALTLRDFLDQAESSKVNKHTLMHQDFGVFEDGFSDCPPCMQSLIREGVGEGNRNTFIFNACTQEKKRNPDKWKKEVEKINIQACTPPLSSRELLQLQKQQEKKDYQYQCNQHPLKAFCNREICKKRKHGIDGGPVLTINGLSVLESDPRVWFVSIDGRTVELSTEQLQVPLQFQRACMEQLHFMPPIPKQADWTNALNTLMQTASVIEVSEEDTERGQFKDFVIEYCTGRLTAQDPSEVTIGKAWTDEDQNVIYFKPEGLERFLEQKGFVKYKNKRGILMTRLSELGGEKSARLSWKDTYTGKKMRVRCWKMPMFEEQEIPTEVELPTKEKVTNDDIPF